MDNRSQVIEQTQKWITEVVVGCNLCPFAAREIKENRLHYQVERATGMAACLDSFLAECQRLDKDKSIETVMLIFPNGFQFFEDYLDLVFLSEQLLKKEGYEGIYQVASFHPCYRFANTSLDDAANYTNRSLYPMLHLLREKSLELALSQFPDPGQIPLRNIHFTREKGIAYMKSISENCL